MSVASTTSQVLGGLTPGRGIGCISSVSPEKVSKRNSRPECRAGLCMSSAPSNSSLALRGLPRLGLKGRMLSSSSGIGEIPLSGQLDDGLGAPAPDSVRRARPPPRCRSGRRRRKSSTARRARRPGSAPSPRPTPRPRPAVGYERQAGFEALAHPELVIDQVRRCQHHRSMFHRPQHRLVVMPATADPVQRHRRLALALDELAKRGPGDQHGRHALAIRERTLGMTPDHRCIGRQRQLTRSQIVLDPRALRRQAFLPQRRDAGLALGLDHALLTTPGGFAGTCRYQPVICPRPSNGRSDRRRHDPCARSAAPAFCGSPSSGMMSRVGRLCRPDRDHLATLLKIRSLARAQPLAPVRKTPIVWRH